MGLRLRGSDALRQTVYGHRCRAPGVIALIEQFSGQDVYVVEQDYTAFILHLDYDVQDPTRAPPAQASTGEA